MVKKILQLVGDFVDDYEAMVPFQTLSSFGYSVTAVCPGKKIGDKVATAVHDFEQEQTFSEKRGHNFGLNGDFSSIQASDYDALLIPGGRAPEYIRLNPAVIAIVKHFSEANKPIASICHGQQVLVAAGVIKGKKLTAYPAVQPDVEAAGGCYVSLPLSEAFVDGTLVTAPAWGALGPFLGAFAKVMGASIVGGKRVLMLVGDFVETYEAMALLAAGHHIDSVCPNKVAGDKVATAVHDFEGHQTYSEKRGYNFDITADFAAIDASSYDALLIPGGRAPEYLRLNPAVISLVKAFNDANKPIAAICHGPQILTAAGILKGRACSAYWACGPDVSGCGGVFKDVGAEDAVADGNIISAPAWPAHPAWLKLIYAALGTSITI